MPENVKKIFALEKGTLLEQKVQEGDNVEKNSLLCIFNANSPLECQPISTNIYSNYKGKIVNIFVKENQHILENEPLVTINTNILENPKNTKSNNTLTSIEENLVLNDSLSNQIRQITLEGLHTTKKLVLVLDIDHTILHATKNPNAELAYSDKDIAFDTFKIHILNTNGKNQPYYVKLRPGLRQFLNLLKNYFHIALYTFGLRPYAEKVMHLIDPDDSIIQQKALCRDDHPEIAAKSLQRLFPCDESVVLVVDDRSDVWETPENVIKCHKFHFQPYDKISCDTTSGNELLSPGEKPLDTVFSLENMLNRNRDTILLTIFVVLRTIHSLYYQFFNKLKNKNLRDVRVLLALAKKSVLKGLTIVFSGIFPLRVKPEEQEIQKLAMEYGAECSTNIDQNTTHVIARRPKTDKVNAANLMNDVYVVHENWLYECVLHFQRVDESKFPLLQNPKLQNYVSSHSENIITQEILISKILENNSIVDIEKLFPSRKKNDVFQYGILNEKGQQQIDISNELPIKQKSAKNFTYIPRYNNISQLKGFDKDNSKKEVSDISKITTKSSLELCSFTDTSIVSEDKIMFTKNLICKYCHSIFLSNKDLKNHEAELESKTIRNSNKLTDIEYLVTQIQNNVNNENENLPILTNDHRNIICNLISDNNLTKCKKLIVIDKDSYIKHVKLFHQDILKLAKENSYQPPDIIQLFDSNFEVGDFHFELTDKNLSKPLKDAYLIPCNKKIKQRIRKRKNNFPDFSENTYISKDFDDVLFDTLNDDALKTFQLRDHRLFNDPKNNVQEGELMNLKEQNSTNIDYSNFETETEIIDLTKSKILSKNKY